MALFIIILLIGILLPTAITQASSTDPIQLSNIAIAYPLGNGYAIVPISDSVQYINISTAVFYLIITLTNTPYNITYNGVTDVSTGSNTSTVLTFIPAPATTPMHIVVGKQTYNVYISYSTQTTMITSWISSNNEMIGIAAGAVFVMIAVSITMVMKYREKIDEVM